MGVMIVTVAQLAVGNKIDAEIRSIKSKIIDLKEVTNVLKVRECDKGVESVTICIETGSEYKKISAINIASFIHFLEEQKSKYEEEVNELNEEFSKL